jgi:hypothetical protein
MVAHASATKLSIRPLPRSRNFQRGNIGMPSSCLMLLQRIWLAGYQFFFSSEEFAIQLRSLPHPILEQLPTSSEPTQEVERDVIARGILTNLEDLARKLRPISTATQRAPSRSSGDILIRPAASAVTLSLPNATSSS